jgi:5,10-methylenetetrahydrofolate reductase
MIKREPVFTKLLHKLQNEQYITLETTPGHMPTIQPIIDKISEHNLDKKVDGFSTTDNPLAKLKYNAILGALSLQNTFKKPVLATVSMRDRNKIALQSDLLGANDHNVRAFLTLTGDSAKISDQPNSKGVFEGDSTLMLDIIKCFNAGMDFSGKPFKVKPEPILGFSVVNSHAKNDNTLLKKMTKKIEHGTVGIITQPVYDLDNAKKMLELHQRAKESSRNPNSQSELILGIFPITKLRTAQFLTAHVPGINVPKIWLDKMYEASLVSIEEEYKVGFKMSKELFEGILDLHPKVHLMTANQFDLANELLS